MPGKPTIYVVDDEAQILDLIAYLVRPIEANVVVFSRADDFLANFRYEGPACLVLDIRMPGMSGLELQAKLVQANCRIPVVFITGYADVKMAVDALKSGARSFFEKPFRPQELFDEIQKILRAEIDSWNRREAEQNVRRRLDFLTAGEREVLNLIAAGNTNEEVAEKLQLSVRGVEARRAKAMKTLRGDSKAELMTLLKFHISSESTKNL
jgi:FixJ family two-component response regulator